jgi:hypothetical protein
MIQYPKIKNLTGHQFCYMVDRIIFATGKKPGEIIELMGIMNDMDIFKAYMEFGMDEKKANANAGRTRKIYKNSVEKFKYNIINCN